MMTAKGFQRPDPTCWYRSRCHNGISTATIQNTNIGYLRAVKYCEKMCPFIGTHEQGKFFNTECIINGKQNEEMKLGQIEGERFGKRQAYSSHHQSPNPPQPQNEC